MALTFWIVRSDKDVPDLRIRRLGDGLVDINQRNELPRLVILIVVAICQRHKATIRACHYRPWTAFHRDAERFPVWCSADCLRNVYHGDVMCPFIGGEHVPALSRRISQSVGIGITPPV